MTTGTVLPPTAGILDLCDLLEDAIGDFLRVRATATGLGEYESSAIGWALSNLLIRHVEGMLELARRDLVLIAPAHNLGRAGFEAGVRLRWLMDPADPFVRESRWIALISEGIDADRRWAKLIEQMGGATDTAVERLATVTWFRDSVRELLVERGYAPIDRPPSLRDMCTAIAADQWYLLYIQASQYTHSTYVAAEAYQKNLGTHRRLGEFIETSDWFWPFRLALWSLVEPLQYSLARWGVQADYPTAASLARLNDSVGALVRDVDQRPAADDPSARPVH